MNKNIQKAILALGVGYGAWIIYKKFQDGTLGKSKTPPVKTDGQISKEVNEAVTASTSPVNEYKVKVMKLQALLNVAVDGAFGPKSTAALSALYNGTLAYGAVSPSNVTKYIEDIELKKTPAQIAEENAIKNAQTSGTISARVSLARKIYNAATTNGKYKKPLTWTDKPGNLSIYKKDSLGRYIKSGDTRSFSKPQTIRYDVLSIDSAGFLRVMYQKVNNVEYYIFVSPYSVTIY